MSETESYDISQPPETMVEQAGNNRVTQWLLITGDRRAVAAAMLVGTFVAFVIFGLYGPRSIQKFLSTGTIGTLFYALMTGIITTVTLVLTLSQFGLSQQLSDLGTFRDHMNHSMEFRRDTENHIDVGVSPGQPTEFFQALARAVEEELDDLDGVMADGDNPSGTGEVAEYIDAVRAYSEDEREQLENPTFGSFGALLPVLNHNYSWKIYLGRQLRDEHADELSEEAMEQFDELIETLLFFGPTREYFKSLYFQRELVGVGRAVLYAALPAIALTGYMMVLFDPTAVSDWLFGVTNVVGISTGFLFVGVVFAFSLLPFALLLAYLLRLLTVMNRTLTIGPFFLNDHNSPSANNSQEAIQETVQKRWRHADRSRPRWHSLHRETVRTDRKKRRLAHFGCLCHLFYDILVGSERCFSGVVGLPSPSGADSNRRGKFS
ncbi:hypothetical protein C448_11946 [Halococcus morrhuae DSM 1307]|uniref:Uncharacterized protein n=1 Tax=Halococcus morrhuae DSM 1307 TaxID=931277 RepID=M0M7S1_HALMO|nr:hypothetical protein [Halococcus morrhuae]EMA41862.1 hypothetical protein C448_11946 [Halococcus morrhuae DSM 1307]